MLRYIRTQTPQLFFIKRLPKPFVEKEWHKPATAAEYYSKLDWEGFISPIHWQEDDVNQIPTLKQDLEDLEEHLLPTFWQLNQKAMYNQNLFYLYQWIFMLGAFFTTLLGALTTYSYTLDSAGGTFTTIIGGCTTILSFILTVSSVLNEQSKPQSRWANARRLSEELRTTYFKYLAHLEPFHKEDRVQQMRQLVLSVRRKENENA